jgi:hypothetical protein
MKTVSISSYLKRIHMKSCSLCYNGLHNGLCCNDGLLWIMTCDDVLNNGLVFVDVYMYICSGQIRIWIIYFFCWKIYCRGGSWLNRPYKYTQQGRLVIQPPLQKSTTGAADITSRPYRGHCRGGWKHQPPLQRHCRGGWKHQPPLQRHCRGGQETAPTEAPSVGTPWEGRLAQPPLQRL